MNSFVSLACIIRLVFKIVKRELNADSLKGLPSWHFQSEGIREGSYLRDEEFCCTAPGACRPDIRHNSDFAVQTDLHG